MTLYSLFLVTSVLLASVCGQASEFPNQVDKAERTPSIEKKLIRHLLSGYKNFGVIGRPVSNRSIQVKVHYGLQLFQVIDLDANKQILQTNCWPIYNWYDDLLKWNESLFGGVTTVRIFPSQIWVPDVKLYNFADERLDERRNIRIVVYSSGHTLWMPQSLYKSTCEVEIAYFPFDTQICMLEFGSWSYDLSQMDILWRRLNDSETSEQPYLDFSDYVKSNTWRTDGEDGYSGYFTDPVGQIKSVKAYRKRTQTVGNTTVTRSYPVLRYLLRLRRNPGTYVILLVIPTILLSTLTLVVFWVPPESPAKMLLGVNLFVAFFLLLQNLSDCTPKAVTNFPLIGVYFCLNMVMITLSMFIATIIVHLHFQGDRRGAVPWLVRQIIINGIGRLLLVRQQIALPEPPRKHKSTRSKKRSSSSTNKGPDHRAKNLFNIERPERNRNSQDQHRGAGGNKGIVDDGYSTSSESSVASSVSSDLSRTSLEDDSSSCDEGSTSPSASSSSSSPALSPPSTGQAFTAASSQIQLERDIHDIRRYIRMFVSRQKIITRKGFVAKEWRTVALVLDRLFFVVYLATIAIVLLVTLPGRNNFAIPHDFLKTDE